VPQYVRQIRELLNHLYRTYGILAYSHAHDRNQIHKHEGKIVYIEIGAYCSPYTGAYTGVKL